MFVGNVQCTHFPLIQRNSVNEIFHLFAHCLWLQLTEEAFMDEDGRFVQGIYTVHMYNIT